MGLCQCEKAANTLLAIDPVGAEGALHGEKSSLDHWVEAAGVGEKVLGGELGVEFSLQLCHRPAV